MTFPGESPTRKAASTVAGGGLTTSAVMRASARYRICDRTMTATQSARNKIAGCGTLLPARSIRSSTLLGFFPALASVSSRLAKAVHPDGVGGARSAGRSACDDHG